MEHLMVYSPVEFPAMLDYQKVWFLMDITNSEKKSVSKKWMVDGVYSKSQILAARNC